MKKQNSEFEFQWMRFHQLAAIAALLIVLVGIGDIAISMSAGEAQENTAVTVTEWFALFQTNPVTALSNLGLINIITMTLGIPVYLALYNVHRPSNPGFALLSAAIFFIGAAIYISSNTVFSMLALSSQYAAASEAEKPLLEAAARAALAQGADLTPGTFMGLVYTQIGGLIMALVMLRAKIFGKWTAWLGIVGYAGMVVFFSLTAFAPQTFAVGMMISMVAGLALMAYHILFARRLFQLSKQPLPQPL